MIYLKHHQEQVLVSNWAVEITERFDLSGFITAKEKEHFISDLKIAVSDKNSVYGKQIN